MSTCFLNVPDPDDQPFDDDEPNKPIPPGDRWCSLWAAREPGGPRLPCHPSIEGTADEWTLIAGAIEAGAPRAFDRVAFAPQAGGGEFWSPRNSTGDRDHVRLTTADLVELAADIRAKLAPPIDTTGAPTSAPEPGSLEARLLDLWTRGGAHSSALIPVYLLGASEARASAQPPAVADYDAYPTHPMAEDGSGPTTGPARAAPVCLYCVAEAGSLAAVRPPCPHGVLTTAPTYGHNGDRNGRAMPIVDQPPPVPSDRPAIWDLVIADMHDRDRVGRERYGTPLQAHNGRKPLVDAYQEVLDLAAYLRQEIEERAAMGGASKSPGAAAAAAGPTRVGGWIVNRGTVYSPGLAVSAWVDGDHLVVEGLTDPERVPLAAVEWLIARHRPTVPAPPTLPADMRALVATWRQGSLDGDDRTAAGCADELDAILAGGGR